MGESRLPKAAQSVQAPDKMKTRTCLDCGFLTIEGCELSDYDRKGLGTYSRNKQGMCWTRADMPAGSERTRCFKKNWKEYDPEISGWSDAGFIGEIERRRDDCPNFAPYEAGLTPSDLIKQIKEDHRAKVISEALAQVPGKKNAKKAQFKGLDGLGQKTNDLSQYYSNLLTPRQRDCFSLKYEYGKTVSEAAARLGLARSTVQEYLKAAERKVRRNRENSKHKRSMDTTETSSDETDD
jgi:predicted DNA-binding protein YlxM (UPF0122 family)